MLPVFARATGEHVWRNDMHRLEVREPDADEAEHGPRAEFADGIYIVTVHEDTPTDWLDLARRASVAAYEQHPGPDFMPADKYDSAIVVANRRVVGGTLVRLESAPRYRWKIQLRPDGEAYTADDLFGEEGEKWGFTFSPAEERPPAIYTIWVHPACRGEGLGGQLVRAVAAHYDLPLPNLCFRLPLSKQAVRMAQRLGLNTIIGCD
jgi:GNAT superfamily N-acetyltransferase